MLLLQLCLLLIKAVYFVPVGICLCHLRKIQEAQQTGQHNQDDGVADWTNSAFIGTKTSGVLIAAGIVLPT
jgi:hypothetical protein